MDDPDYDEVDLSVSHEGEAYKIEGDKETYKIVGDKEDDLPITNHVTTLDSHDPFWKNSSGLDVMFIFEGLGPDGKEKPWTDPIKSRNDYQAAQRLMELKKLAP
jgi:hypothetical protein